MLQDPNELNFFGRLQQRMMQRAGIPQAYAQQQGLLQAKELVGTRQTPYEMSEEELFPGEDQATAAPGLLNKGTGYIGTISPNLEPERLAQSELYGGLLTTPGYQQTGAQGLMGLSGKGETSDFKNVKQDDLGNWWGVKNGQVQQIPMTGNNQYTQYKTVQSTDASGAPITELVNMNIATGNNPERITVGSKGFSDVQNTAAGFTNRMVKATKTLDDVVGSGYDPSNLQDKAAGAIPIAGNYMKSTEAKKYTQAQEDWVRAKLRKESGAVIGDDEMSREISVYFPQPGDSPQVIQQKAVARWTATQAMAHQSQGAFIKQNPQSYKYYQNYNPATRGVVNFEELK